MEMRLGKTLVAIRRSKMLRIQRALVIAPYSALSGWIRELDLEGEDPPALLFGTRLQRLKILAEKKDLVKWFLINREGHLSIPEIAQIPWDLVILDESTCIKAPRTKISEFFCSNFRKVKTRMILTGTPAPESDLDYYQQLRFLDPQILPQPNYYDFRFKFFGTIRHETLISPKGSRYISQQLSRYCFFLTRRDVNLGGAKIYERRCVRMDDKSRAAYRKLLRRFVLEYDGEIIDWTVFATTRYIWLRRLCGGFIEDELVNKSKVKDLVYLLKTELKDQSIVIWCKFTKEIDMIYSTLLDEGFTCGRVYGKIMISERNEIQYAFQTEEIKILIAQPECFKHGVDLSQASTLIYYSSPDGLETRQQTEARGDKIGSDDSTLIIDMITLDTIEEDVIESLMKKEGRQEMMRRIVRRIQSEGEAI